MKRIYLYREMFALGLATHWARDGGEKPGFEFLGLGERYIVDGVRPVIYSPLRTYETLEEIACS